MPKAALELVRELGQRMGDFVLVDPTSAGGTNTIIDSDLIQYFPQPLQQFNGWIYCNQNSPNVLNRGLERRAQSWDGTSQVLLYTGFPQPVTAGDYELHLRHQHSRKIAAINSAVGQLGLTWYRQIVDETITTQQATWRYELDPLTNWSGIYRIEIEINLSETQIGYPYADAEYLNWRPRRWVDQLGIEHWVIEFGILPPIDRKLRIFGEGFYPQLQVDTDVLAIAGKWEGGALEWIYDWAEFRLNDAFTNRIPTGEAEKIRQQALDRLERQKNDVLVNAPTHMPGRIVTPGHGDAMAFPSPEDWRFLGAFRSASFIRGG
jgi:hypothetical protein